MSLGRIAFLLLLLVQASAFAESPTTAVYSYPTGNRLEVRVGDWTLPKEPTPGSVRVEITRCQICQSDRRVIEGTKKSSLDQGPLVMGHEGLGIVRQLPPGYQGTLKVGDQVVVLPHYVKADDPYEAKGVPNLSPDMKHLGFHLNGVFAGTMDFPEYTAWPIPDIGEVKDQKGYLDQLVKAEPLACTQRSYKLLEAAKQMPPAGARVLIQGAGPMGILHAMHLQNKYPGLEVFVWDTDPARRQLAKEIPNFRAKVLDSMESAGQFDLVVTAMSDPKGNQKDAPNYVKDGGTVLLFSGINMKAGDPRPLVGGLDIETVHRQEGIAELDGYETDTGKKHITFVGTSGYTKDDIATSVRELQEDFRRAESGGPGVYRWVTTTLVEGVHGKVAHHILTSKPPQEFDVPALKALLESQAHEHLKIVVRPPEAPPAKAPSSPPSKELVALSEFLAPIQKEVHEKFGIGRVYFGGGSARALLDHLFRGKPLEMRDLDLFMTLGKKVSEEDLKWLADRLEALQLGKVIRSELQPRIRSNPDLPPAERNHYVTGYGFAMERPDGADLDLSIYNNDTDHRRNGMFDIDTLLVPLDFDQSLVQYREKALRTGLENLAGQGLLVDDFNGYRTWVERRPPQVAHWEEVLRDPVLQSVRALRTFQKVGIETMPQYFVERLRAGMGEFEGEINRRSFVRNLEKLLGDANAASELHQLVEVGTIEKWSPELAAYWKHLSVADLQAVFDRAVPVAGAKLSEVGLGRLVELVKLLPVDRRGRVLPNIVLLEPEFASLVACPYREVTPARGANRLRKTGSDA